MTQNATVVVGMDGSEHSRHALAWAAREAADRDAELQLVHAFPFDQHLPPERDPHVRLASERLRDVAEDARRLAGRSIEVSSAVLDGLPSRMLVEASRRAALLVVGRRGHGGFEDMLLGSTSLDVTASATCPVVVVPEAGLSEQDATRPVVLGADASEGSRPAAAFAFARAAARRTPLLAVHVWNLRSDYGTYAGTDSDEADRVRRAREAEVTLGTVLEPWLEAYPEVDVQRRVVHGQTVAELARASGPAADLVVVGSRGHTTLRGMLLGSVSHGLLRHSGGPVAVVR